MVLMFASMIPLYGGAVRKRAFAYTGRLYTTVVFETACASLQGRAERRIDQSRRRT